MANSTRKRSKELLQEFGLTTKDLKGTWHRLRDWNENDLADELKIIKETGSPSVQKAPSDIPKPKREEYREIFEPKRRKILEPPPKPEPPPPEIPQGKVVVFWKDITKRGRTSRYPNALKELRHLKRMMKDMDPEEIIEKLKEVLSDDDGKIGDIEIKLYQTPEQLKQLKKEYRGWNIIYDGKGQNKKDLLIGFAAVCTGVYNLSLTKAAATKFIREIKKIHPTNGQWLDEIYRSIT
jgi:hypothetical protein